MKVQNIVSEMEIANLNATQNSIDDWLPSTIVYDISTSISDANLSNTNPELINFDN